MTATEWDYESMDPTGWLMTEKYDGMRLYWTGKEFLTRQGKKVKVPEKVTNQLPSVAFDGELWTRYGLHQQAVYLCTKGGEWDNATYWVFDAPDMPRIPYEVCQFICSKLK
jgi:DNA ligase-1